MEPIVRRTPAQRTASLLHLSVRSVVFFFRLLVRRCAIIEEKKHIFKPERSELLYRWSWKEQRAIQVYIDARNRFPTECHMKYNACYRMQLIRYISSFRARERVSERRKWRKGNIHKLIGIRLYTYTKRNEEFSMRVSSGNHFHGKYLSSFSHSPFCLSAVACLSPVHTHSYGAGKCACTFTAATVRAPTTGSTSTNASGKRRMNVKKKKPMKKKKKK